jgi:microcystin-dependent protein
MADNTLFTRSNGQKVRASDHNSYFNALKEDHVPRNSSGAPTNEGGDLGTSTYRWKTAYLFDVNISTGYLFTGMVVMFHDFNGTVSAGQGWMKLNGDVVNQSNYDALHSAGDWATYVGSSPLDGKNLPNMNNKYPAGSTNTTQSGSSAITSVGNSGNTINISHSHSVDAHIHSWYRSNSNSTTDQTYNASGNTKPIDQGTGKNGGVLSIAVDSGGTSLESVGTTSSFMYTDARSPGTDSKLSSSQSIRPESIEFEFWIRVV